MSTTEGMKVIVDMAVLVDDTTSRTMMFSSNTRRPDVHYPSVPNPSYLELQYTNCFAQSEWQPRGKQIYETISLFLKSPADLIIYCKCPKEYVNWMTRERKAWCVREFGHNFQHSLLVFESKSGLRKFMTHSYTLITCNYNLYNYWTKYSSKCVLLSVEEATWTIACRNGLLDQLRSHASSNLPVNHTSSGVAAYANSKGTDGNVQQTLIESEPRYVDNKLSFKLPNAADVTSGNIENNYVTFCDDYVEYLLILRNIVLLCTMYDYGTTTRDGASATVAEGEVESHGVLVGDSVCEVALSFRDEVASRNCEDENGFCGSTVEGLLADVSASPLCQKMQVKVAASSAMLSRHPSTLSSNSTHNDRKVVVTMTYNALEAINCMFACPMVAAGVIIRYINSTLTVYHQTGERMPPLLPPHTSHVARFITEVKESFQEDESTSSGTFCLKQLTEIIFTHTVSLVVTNYCMHTSPSFALSHSQIPAPIMGEKLRIMESVFCGVAHLNAYVRTRTWREDVALAHEQGLQEHRHRVQHQWDHMGEAWTNSDVSDDDAHEVNNNDGIGGMKCDIGDVNYAGTEGLEGGYSTSRGHPMMSYCSDEAHNKMIILLQQVVKIDERADTGSSGIGQQLDGASVTNDQPYCCSFTGISLMFGCSDYSELSSEFVEAGLWHFLPLWAVCSGLLTCVDYLQRRGQWRRERFQHDDDWRDDLWKCLAVVEGVLFWWPSKALNEISDDIHKEMLSSLRFACWTRRVKLYSLLYGAVSPRVQGLLTTALGECETNDNGYSPAKIHDMHALVNKYRSKVNNSKGHNGSSTNLKRKRGKGLARKRLKNARNMPKRVDESTIIDSDESDSDQYLPRKEAGGVVYKSEARDFRGHFEGRSNGRLLYRRITTFTTHEDNMNNATGNLNADDVDDDDDEKVCDNISHQTRQATMKVEHFAMCRYLSLLSRDIGQQTTAPVSMFNNEHKCSYQDIIIKQENCQKYGRVVMSGQSGHTDAARNVNVSLILDGLGDKVNTGKANFSVGQMNYDRVYPQCAPLEEADMESFSSVWTSRGPGAWAHAMVHYDNTTNSSSPSSKSHPCMSENTWKKRRELRSITWLGSYCEGSIWRALFVMLMYDEIYSTDMPLAMMDRAFLNRPVDFLPECHAQHPHGSPINCDYFYKRRRGKISQKLSHLRDLSDRKLANTVSTSLIAHWGERLHGISWDKIDPYFVTSVAWSLGAGRLVAVLNAMLRDPVCFSRGMPDLLFCQAMPMTSFNYDDSDSDDDDGDGDDGDVVDGTGERCGCCPWNSGRCGLGRGCGISQHNKKLFVSEVKRYSLLC